MKKHIVLCGGGTLGPVTPLLAIVEEARARGVDFTFTWIGTRSGPERSIVTSYGLPFVVVTSDKWRSYADIRNILLPFTLFLGFFESLWKLFFLKPDIVVSSGSFVSVPVTYAAWCLGIPVALHALDKQAKAIGVIAPVAKMKTSVWPRSGFHTIGAFVLPSHLQGRSEIVREQMKLSDNVPLVLITGGGTGAQQLNSLVVAMKDQLSERAAIVHLTGPGKETSVTDTERYRQIDFAGEQMKNFLAVADVVVTRGGMGTLAELAALRKPAIVIPIAHSPQVDNAQYLSDRRAVVVLDPETVLPDGLLSAIESLLVDASARVELGAALHEAIPDATAAYVHLLQNLDI